MEESKTLEEILREAESLIDLDGPNEKYFEAIAGIDKDLFKPLLNLITKAYKAGEETRNQKWAWMRPEDRERKAKDIQILTQERSGRS